MAERIESSRLILEPLAKTQLQQVHNVFGDPQASFWSLSGRSETLDNSEKLMDRILNDVNDSKCLIWGVYLRDQEDECIGFVNLKIKEPWEPGELPPGPGPTWIVAYMFLPAHWGKGYATEAVEAMIEGARAGLQPCTVQAYINPANPPSMKVAQKLGFELVEKIYKPEEPRVFIGGEWREYDVWRYIRKLE